MSSRPIYEQRARENQEKAALFRQKSRWYPWLRAGFFLTALVFAIRVWAGELSPSWMVLAVGCFLAFLAAAVRHQYLQNQQLDAERLHQVNVRSLQRCDDLWHHFPQTGIDFDTPEHPYAHDLDIFGQGSLFQMINVTTTWFGHQTLGKWLLQRASFKEIQRRQALVDDLKDRLELRQALEQAGLRIESTHQKADPESFLVWVESETALLQKKWLHWLTLLLPPWVTVTMGYWMLKVLPPWLAGAQHPAKFAPYSAWIWLLPWLVLLGLFVTYVGTCQDIFRKVIFHEKGFSLYRTLFERIYNEPAQGTPLASIQERLQIQGYAPHEAMKKLQKLIDLAEVRQSPIIHLPLNLLFLWDIHCLFGMERWKKQLQGGIRGWFKELGEIEALSSFAGLAYDNPNYAFPTILETKEGEKNDRIFEVIGLGHPLLPAKSRVTNDLTLDQHKPLMLVTGSNMSGKSTMLRSIGLNAVLAYAGCVVCAESLRISLMQIGTSMRIADSLEHGISYFMAELKRIHRIVSFKDAEDPLLYLLDEILHGTNTRERRMAAISIISLLQEAESIGCVTTHDLELAEECKQFGDKVQFTYFTDLIEENEMKFDYQLREGICPTTNALKLMRIVGIPLPETFDE